jgi:hypothetical protein
MRIRRMIDTRTQDYLQQVLNLDAHEDAKAILRLRQSYLAGNDWIEAEIADDVDPRVHALVQLNKVRERFWHLSPDELTKHLTLLARSTFPDVASAATRLVHVAQQREALRSLAQHPQAHPQFLKALAAILLASPAEANRLRERELNWMRPEHNPSFVAAMHSVQGTVHAIRAQFPSVFALESSWFTEILEYSPHDEVQNDGSLSLFGICVLMMFAGTIVAILYTIQGIF